MGFEIPLRGKGSDIALTLSFKDDDGNAINIDDLTELYVYFLYGDTTTPVMKFSKAGTGDDTDALVKVDTTHYRADWLSAETAEAKAGYYDVEVNIVQNNAAYALSQKNTIKKYTFVELIETTIKELSS